jgi:transcription factor SPT20
MAGYNRTRYVEQLLEKTESLPPSISVHLHSEHWVLNNGSKFQYNNQIAVRNSIAVAGCVSLTALKSLLDDIRAHRIPIDFLELFDSARVPFYEGQFTSSVYLLYANVMQAAWLLSSWIIVHIGVVNLR